MEAGSNLLKSSSNPLMENNSILSLAQLTPSQAAGIAKCLKSKDVSAFMTDGVHGDVRYQFFQVQDDKFVAAKRKCEGGLAMQASKTAIVIAHCPAEGQLCDTSKGVSVIADYLESTNM